METNANLKEPDELTIRPGEILRDVDRLPSGWWRGELHGRPTMYPENYTSLLDEQITPRSRGGKCRALYSYQPANPDELPLCVGDILEVVAEVEEGWWQGRRQGRIGVFPSNFVAMLDPQPSASAFEHAPALPPKPVKEQCRVLFPYTAVNDDELNLVEGDIVTILSKEAPDRGWWRGELHGRVGLFPDNFVQLLPSGTPEVEEKKPDRPPSKTTNVIYPILNKYTEKTASVKELTTSKISIHKENTISKESTTQSTVTHTNKSESEKLIHSETFVDGSQDGQVKKPPVPLKKSPTPTSGVSGLFSGLKNKMLSSTDKEKSVSSGSSSSGEWDRIDGTAGSKPATNATTNATPTANTNANASVGANTNTFDHVERNSILNDPRAGRVKAPRRRPPSQSLRDDTPLQLGLSNGHEVSAEKPATEKAEEIKPRTREWEKHKAPWMEELKLNQAKKTSFGSDSKSRTASTSSEVGVTVSKASSGSTDRILDCGLEEKKASHSMEMSKSTSSISSKISVLESFEETKVRHSLDAKKDVTASPRDMDSFPSKPVLHSPTAAGRTLTAMLDEVKKPHAPAPPASATRPTDLNTEKSPTAKLENLIVFSDKPTEISNIRASNAIFEKSTLERIEKVDEKLPVKPGTMSLERSGSTLERLKHSFKAEKSDGTDALIAQLNNRICNLEKLLEVQNAKFNAAIDDLNTKLKLETDKRVVLQAELEKLAHCVTQV